MTEAASHVRSGQVTYAARDSEFDGKKIKQGEYLSLSEGRLCASGRETSVLKKLVREMVSDDSAFATVIFGEGVTEEQAAEVENLLHKANKDMEISVINGGQPVYYYILSVESKKHPLPRLDRREASGYNTDRRTPLCGWPLGTVI